MLYVEMFPGAPCSIHSIPLCTALPSGLSLSTLVPSHPLLPSHPPPSRIPKVACYPDALQSCLQRQEGPQQRQHLFGAGGGGARQGEVESVRGEGGERSAVRFPPSRLPFSTHLPLPFLPLPSPSFPFLPLPSPSFPFLPLLLPLGPLLPSCLWPAPESTLWCWALVLQSETGMQEARQQQQGEGLGLQSSVDLQVWMDWGECDGVIGG